MAATLREMSHSSDNDECDVDESDDDGDGAVNLSQRSEYKSWTKPSHLGHAVGLTVA